jgi:hypothetical protein
MLGYAVGLLLGAALSGLVVLTLGSLLWGAVQAPAAARTALLGAIAIGLAVRELGLVDFPLPQNQRLVPESVFGLGHFGGPLVFGFEMGTGVRTYVTSSLPYLLVAAIFCVTTWDAMIFGATGFAVGRTLMMVASIVFGDVTGWRDQFLLKPYLRLPLLLMTAASLLVIVQLEVGH